jgi:hypothetical protein
VTSRLNRLPSTTRLSKTPLTNILLG